MNDKLLEKYPLDRMKKLQRESIALAKELYKFELCMTPDIECGLDVIHSIAKILSELTTITYFLSEYTLSKSMEANNEK